MNDLKENLHNVRARVESACEKVGRSPEEIALLAVSKKHGTGRMRALYELGQRAFGENYVQEALDKMAQLTDLDIEWHYIGPMQSNKTRAVAEHFDWAQSVDREKTLRRLSSQRPAGKPPLNICIQVNIDREPQKAGVDPDLAEELARKALGQPGVRLRGLMAIPQPASPGHDPADSYVRMKRLFDRLRAGGMPLDTLSLGMSADLESAIMHGSTMIRVGTALLGPRL